MPSSPNHSSIPNTKFDRSWADGAMDGVVDIPLAPSGIGAVESGVAPVRWRTDTRQTDRHHLRVMNPRSCVWPIRLTLEGRSGRPPGLSRSISLLPLISSRDCFEYPLTP